MNVNVVAEWIRNEVEHDVTFWNPYSYRFISFFDFSVSVLLIPLELEIRYFVGFTRRYLFRRFFFLPSDEGFVKKKNAFDFKNLF